MSKTNTKVSPKGTKSANKTQLLKQLEGEKLGTKSLQALQYGVKWSQSKTGTQPQGYLERATILKELRSLGKQIGFKAQALKGLSKRELRSLISPNVVWSEVQVSKKSSPKVRVTGGKVDLALVPADDTPAKSPKGTKAKKTKTEPTIHEVNAKLEKLINVVEKLALAQA